MRLQSLELAFQKHVPTLCCVQNVESDRILTLSEGRHERFQWQRLGFYCLCCYATRGAVG